MGKKQLSPRADEDATYGPCYSAVYCSPANGSKSTKDIKKGKTHGPFETHEQMMAFLHSHTVQKAFDKQTKFLLHNLKHPSLHAKKYDESQDIWQARVNRDWRFYFSMDGDTYIIRNIIPHSK